METLAVIEVLDRSGQVQARERVTSLPAIVGRGYDATLILDDPFVAAHHLQIDIANDGQIQVSDLGSENGFSVHGIAGRVAAASTANVAPGNVIRLGHTQIRIWLPGSPVAPELRARRTERNDLVRAAGWVIGVAVLVLIDGGASATGLNRHGTTISSLIIVLSLLLAWSGLWWLSSSQGARRPPFMRHLAIGARMVSLVAIGTYAINSIAFALDGYALLDYHTDKLLLALVAIHAVYAHLRVATRRSVRTSLIQACMAVAVLLVPLEYAMRNQQLDKVGTIEMQGVVRPAWMVVSEGIAPDALFDK